MIRGLLVQLPTLVLLCNSATWSWDLQKATEPDMIKSMQVALALSQLLFQSLLALQLSLRDAGSTSHSANYPTRGLHGLQLSCMLFEDMSKLRRLVSSDLFAARRLFRSRPQISEPWSLQQLLPPSCCGDPLKRDGEFRIVWAWACTGLARPGEFPARPSTLFSL